MKKKSPNNNSILFNRSRSLTIIANLRTATLYFCKRFFYFFYESSRAKNSEMLFLNLPTACICLGLYCVCRSYSSGAYRRHMYDIHGIDSQVGQRCDICREVFSHSIHAII